MAVDQREHKLGRRRQYRRQTRTGGFAQEFRDRLRRGPEAGIDETYISPGAAMANRFRFKQADGQSGACGMERRRAARVAAAGDNKVGRDVT
ncbi:MAG: hypothetical protein R3D43_12755 [Tepidamorphaceae bacterium]